MYMPTKNYLRKKAIKLCIRAGSNCDPKSQLSEIFTERLNSRVQYSDRRYNSV